MKAATRNKATQNDTNETSNANATIDQPKITFSGQTGLPDDILIPHFFTFQRIRVDPVTGELAIFVVEKPRAESKKAITDNFLENGWTLNPNCKIDDVYVASFYKSSKIFTGKELNNGWRDLPV